MLKPCVVPQCGELSGRLRCPGTARGTPAAVEPAATPPYGIPAAQCPRLQAFCRGCGAPEDLRADHDPEARARHDGRKPIGLRSIDVVSGRCNRAQRVLA